MRNKIFNGDCLDVMKTFPDSSIDFILTDLPYSITKNKWDINKQMQERTGGGLSRSKYKFNLNSKSENYREFEGRTKDKAPDLRVPSSWQKFNVEVGLPQHKNQCLYSNI